MIFDLDGTLLDSLDDIRDALVATLGVAGDAAPDRDTVRRWIGGGARELVAHALAARASAAPVPAAAAEAEIDATLAAFRDRYHAAPVVHSRLYDGVAEVLDALVAAGRPLAVLTNKPHALTQEIAAIVLARWPWRAIVGQRPGGPLKPDPAAAAPVLDALGVAPAACVMVGDSDIDVHAARAVGMRAVAVSWGFRPRAELVASTPDALVDAPHELLAALA